MENEQTTALAIALDKPVEEVVKDIVISWNNEQLKKEVEARLKTYEGIVYDESAIAVAKKDHADLNKFCKALDDTRKSIGKIYDAPLVAFKKQVDEILDLVNVAKKSIADQITAFENEKQAEKQAEVRKYFDSVIGEFAELIPYERIHNEKWLNASYSMKQVKTDIDKIIFDARNAFIAISALKSPDETTLKAYYCRTLDLSAALTENERLKAEREKIAAIKSEAPQAAEQVDEKVDKTVDAPVAAQAQLYEIRFAARGTREQLSALKVFMQETGIVFSPIKEGK